MRSLLLAGLPALGLLASCVALEPQQCASVDWYERGLRHGGSGFSQDNHADLREICAKAGIAPDVAGYERGWTVGIRTFCTVERGYDHGRSGEPMASNCGMRFPAYAEGWNQGVALYCLPDRGLALGISGTSFRDVCPYPLRERFRVNHARGLEIRELKKKVSELDGDIKKERDRLNETSSPSASKPIAGNRLKTLEEELAKTRRTLAELERRGVL